MAEVGESCFQSVYLDHFIYDLGKTKYFVLLIPRYSILSQFVEIAKKLLASSLM
jgi:hypothetical protein